MYTFVTVTSVTITLYLVRSSSPCIPLTIINNKDTSLLSLIILFDIPGRESLIHFTGDVRRETPKKLWWAAHLRMESQRWSKCTQGATSEGLRRDDVGHVKRWVLSRGVRSSHRHGGGVRVPIWSPEDHSLFGRRRKRREDSSRVRPQCNLMCQVGVRVYSWVIRANQANHSVEVAVVKWRAK